MHKNDMAHELFVAAKTVCALREKLERAGFNASLDFTWDNGLTNNFQVTQCWRPILFVDGIEIK